MVDTDRETAVVRDRGRRVEAAAAAAAAGGGNCYTCGVWHVLCVNGIEDDLGG